MTIRMSPFRSAFLQVSLFINGAWVAISTSELSDAGVSITRGRKNEGGLSEPSRVSLSLKDNTGKWNPRHPSSPYFGLIGRGTPLRVQVELESGTVYTRWVGEVVTWEPRWTLTGGRDSRVDIEAAGTLRRLGAGASPLRSVLYRACSTLGSNLVAYWPMEDEQYATQYSVAVGTAPMTVKGTSSPANYSGFQSSEPIPTVDSSTLSAIVPAYTATTSCQVRWVGMIPSGSPNNGIVMSVYLTGGTLARVDFAYGTGGNIGITGYDRTDVSVGTGGYAFALDNQKMRYSIELTQSGSNVTWTFADLAPGSSVGTAGGGTFTGVTLGSVSKVVVNPNRAAFTNMAFGHLTVEKAVTTLFAVSGQPLAGYAGERADDRISRLCSENGLLYETYSTTGAQLMGPQGTDDLLTLMRECEATDGGMLYEPRTTNDITYRTGESLYSQTPVALTYVENQFLPFAPTEDDQALRNKVTVTRDGGASSTVQATTGTLGTSSVGVYDEQVTLSLYRDIDAIQQAGWRVHLGTTDQPRWPEIGVDLADPRILSNSTLLNKLLGIGLGSRIEITGIPSWLPPFAVSQLVQGYTEQITPLSYRIVFNCTPASPYRGAFYNASTDRYSGEGTVLSAAISTTSATTFTVTPPGTVTWTHADGDYDIIINGEQMTVTNVSGNTFTVTRAVNGVAKTHASGSAVALADPCYYGL